MMLLPENFTGVSVVIPCRNEELYIRKCIESIIHGTKPEIPIEILVIDGMSCDNTRQIVEELMKLYHNVKLIDNPFKETQYALNIGVRNASMSHVMIAGAHSAFPDQYIERLLDSMVVLNADGVGGSLETKVFNETPTSVAIAQILSHPAGVGNSMFRIGAMQPVQVDTVPFGIYPIEVFEQVGCYNELLKRNHDMEWSKRMVRAGKKIFLIPDVRCTYYARETYTGLARNNYKNGLWNMLVVAHTRTLRSLSIRHFIPLGFVGSILIGLFAGIFFFPFLLAGLCIFCLYLLFILTIASTMNKQKTTVLHLVFGFMVLHFSYGIGSFIGLLKGIFILFGKSM